MTPRRGLLLLALALAAPAEARADSTWTDHYRASQAAYAAGDFPAAVRSLERADSILGGHPGVRYLLARAEARRGSRAAALAHLASYAASGMVRDVASDSALVSLREDPEFRRVAALIRANGEPVSHATLAFTLPDTSMLAEDVAWDAATRTFYVSSGQRRKIVALDSRGAARDFVNPARDGVWAIYGLAVDAPRRRLWATSCAAPGMDHYDSADSGRTALLAYDLGSGRLLRRIEHPRDGARHVIGDLAVGPDGTVYASESMGGAVYRVRPGGDSLETLVPPGILGSPQAPALAPGGRLFVADYTRGIAVVNLASREVSWLARPRDVAVGGIDGLVLDGRRLFAVQNGTSPKRVVRFDLDAACSRITGLTVLERATSWLGEPTHGVLAGKDFVFIGRSGWERVGSDGRMTQGAGAEPPVLLRVPRSGAR